MFRTFRASHVSPPPPPSQSEESPAESGERRVSLWEPETVPAAVPCIFTSKYNGKPALGTAVFDAEMPSELPLLLEVVPPEEAFAAPRVLRKGGYVIFSDDYVHKYPESEVADMVRQYCELRSGGSSTTEQAAEARPNDSVSASTTENGVTPSTSASMTSPGLSLTSPNSSVTGAAKTKKQEVRECIREAWATNRPLFRPRNPSSVYGKATYVKRNFHDIMDDEYPIEYII